MDNSSSRNIFLPGISDGSGGAFGVGDTTISSSTPATGSGKIMSERSDPTTRRSRLTGEILLPGAARRIGGVPVSTATGGATLDICVGTVVSVSRGTVRDANGSATRCGNGGTIGGCATAGVIWRTAGGVSRGTARDANGGSARGGTREPIAGGTR